MTPFERLLAADENTLATTLARAGAGGADPELRRETMSQRLGMSQAQLICAVGFNPATVEITGAAVSLGFSDYDALIDERNFLFINDVYATLSIDAISDIYRILGQEDEALRMELGDVILTRLGNIESQIEATINPVMLSSYKLEIRGIYENRLATPELIATRLRPEYGPLRGIADEILTLIRAGLVSAESLLKHPGVSPDEKRRLYFHDLVSADQLRARLGEPTVSEREREVLNSALQGGVA